MNEETEAALMRAGHQIEQLQRENERLRTALQRIARSTNATPGLSESGCGRLLALIEHEALEALKAMGRK